jgi:hypothetical protein
MGEKWKKKKNGQDTLFVFLKNHDPHDFACTQCTLDSSFNVELHELLKNDHINICYSDSLYSHFMSTTSLKGQWLPNSWINLSSIGLLFLSLYKKSSCTARFQSWSLAYDILIPTANRHEAF